MVAGEDHQGSLSHNTKKTVVNFEHRAAMAKVIRSKNYFDGVNQMRPPALVGPNGDILDNYVYEFF